MYKIKEAKLSEISKNLEAIIDSLGKWVNLSIETDTRVIVTSNKRNLLKKRSEVQILGELPKEHSKSISSKIYAGKTIKARIYDICPSFITTQRQDPLVMVSIWEN